MLLLEFEQSLGLYDETLVVAMLKAAIFRLPWQIPNILFDYRMTPHSVQPDYTPMPVEPMKFGTYCPVPDCDKNVPRQRRTSSQASPSLPDRMESMRSINILSGNSRMGFDAEREYPEKFSGYSRFVH